MKSSTKNAHKSARDIAYYTQRYRNRVFSKLVSWVADYAARNKLTRKDVADILNKDPAQITRWLKHPGNLTLDTIAELALAFDAEPEPPEFVFFKDRAQPNYMHPLIARALNVSTPTPPAQAKPSNAGNGELTLINSGRTIRVMTTAS